MIMLLSPSGRTMPTASAQDFERLIRTRWPDAVVMPHPIKASPNDLQADVEARDGSGWRIYHASSGQSVATDHYELRFELGEWACSWMEPDDDLLLLDMDNGRVVRLAQGLTVNQLADMEEDANWDEIGS